MRKAVLLLIFLLSFMSLSAQNPVQKALADAYLDKFAGYAVEEMHRSGVPASITLAQGMLESSYGRSELAVEANNHFGIQCHSSWKGKRYEYMDSGELRQFRKYKTVLESYKDHSDFLLMNKRYSRLFELEKTDYKGWAKGLKKAGYAEDPEYAAKLIKVIEMYDLDKYDQLTEVPARPKKKDKKKDEKEEKSPVVSVVKKEVQSDRQHRTYSYDLNREMCSQNGVPFIYAYDGESYSDIARQYDLFVKEILRFNDAPEDAELKPGTVVYLQAKKMKAAKGYEQYVVEEGMGMHEISQKYAVKLKNLCKMNNVPENYVPKVGEIITLR